MTEKFYRREQLVNKEVYDAKAMHVGTAKDVAHSVDGRTALVVSKGEKEETIPFQDISEIGDIVLLKKTLAETQNTEPAPRADKPETETTTPSYWKEVIRVPPPPSPEKQETSKAQGPSVPTRKTCPKCQRENKPTAKFCAKCGFRLA